MEMGSSRVELGHLPDVQSGGFVICSGAVDGVARVDQAHILLARRGRRGFEFAEAELSIDEERLLVEASRGIRSSFARSGILRLRGGFPIFSTTDGEVWSSKTEGHITIWVDDVPQFRVRTVDFDNLDVIREVAEGGTIRRGFWIAKVRRDCSVEFGNGLPSERTIVDETLLAGAVKPHAFSGIRVLAAFEQDHMITERVGFAPTSKTEAAVIAGIRKGSLRMITPLPVYVLGYENGAACLRGEDGEPLFMDAPTCAVWSSIADLAREQNRMVPAGSPLLLYARPADLVDVSDSELRNVLGEKFWLDAVETFLEQSGSVRRAPAGIKLVDVRYLSGDDFAKARQIATPTGEMPELYIDFGPQATDIGRGQLAIHLASFEQPVKQVARRDLCFNFELIKSNQTSQPQLTVV